MINKIPEQSIVRPIFLVSGGSKVETDSRRKPRRPPCGGQKETDPFRRSPCGGGRQQSRDGPRSVVLSAVAARQLVDLRFILIG